MSTTPIDPPLKSPYRAAEKASFFAAYDRLESVGVVHDPVDHRGGDGLIAEDLAPPPES